MSLLDSAEGRRAARLLELDALLEDVSRHCSLGRAARVVRALEPLDDPEALASLWAWVEELLGHLGRDRDLPLGDFADLEELLGTERAHGGPLDPPELAAVGGAAVGMALVLEAVQRDARSLPRCAEHLRGAENPRGLGEHLEAALEPDGRIKDGASPKLRGLRREALAAEQRLRDTARNALSKAVEGGWTSGNELVLRGDRFCVALRAGQRRRVPGIVHDRSGSGQTLFVEPLEVVESGNLLQEARLAILEEERRIVAALNAAVAERADALLDLHERVVTLDALRARARWGRQHEGEVPRLTAPGSGELRLEEFRHPLLHRSLAAAGRAEDLVPLRLRLQADDHVLLVSGPNAGGKTVAMKSLGLAALMAQSGIPLPTAEPARLPVFDRVLLDLGDEQSIADALSSFSAHLTHLREILALATPASLVLLDEVGGGTDPQEGVALARAVLERLSALGATTLATTHYGQLKALVHESAGFRNASMAYDQERLQPRFDLRLDLPGASHALEIAGRLRLPEDLLERARALVGDESLRLDRLLLEMEAERVRLREEREEAQGHREALESERRRYEEMAREIRQERRRRLDAAEQEAAGILRNARARVERVLRDVREAGGGEEAVQAAAEARREVDESAERLAERMARRQTERRGRRPARLEPGALVRHVGLGQVGRIVEIKGRRITLEIAGRRVVAEADRLVAPDAGESELPPPGGTVGAVRTELSEPATPLSSVVDVRGEDREDAWRAVDKAVDRCLLSGVRSLEIIHGKGTGALREALSARLKADPRVRGAHVGGGGRYDEGVTVVEL